MTSIAVATKVRLPGTASIAISANAARHVTVPATLPPGANPLLLTATLSPRHATAPARTVPPTRAAAPVARVAGG